MLAFSPSNCTTGSPIPSRNWRSREPAAYLSRSTIGRRRVVLIIMLSWRATTDSYMAGDCPSPTASSLSQTEIRLSGSALWDCKIFSDSWELFAILNENYNSPEFFLVSGELLMCFASLFHLGNVVCITQRWLWGRRGWSFWWPWILGVICFGCPVIVATVHLLMIPLCTILYVNVALSFLSFKVFFNSFLVCFLCWSE